MRHSCFRSRYRTSTACGAEAARQETSSARCRSGGNTECPCYRHPRCSCLGCRRSRQAGSMLPAGPRSLPGRPCGSAYRESTAATPDWTGLVSSDATVRSSGPYGSLVARRAARIAEGTRRQTVAWFAKCRCFGPRYSRPRCPKEPFFAKASSHARIARYTRERTAGRYPPVRRPPSEDRWSDQPWFGPFPSKRPSVVRRSSCRRSSRNGSLRWV